MFLEAGKANNLYIHFTQETTTRGSFKWFAFGGQINEAFWKLPSTLTFLSSARRRFNSCSNSEVKNVSNRIYYFTTQKPQPLRDNDPGSWPVTRTFSPNPHHLTSAVNSPLVDFQFYFYIPNTVSTLRTKLPFKEAQLRKLITFPRWTVFFFICDVLLHFTFDQHSQKANERSWGGGDQRAARLQIPDVAHVEKGALDRPCPAAPG